MWLGITPSMKSMFSTPGIKTNTVLINPYSRPNSCWKTIVIAMSYDVHTGKIKKIK
jgi:hypothetical protein